MWGRGAATGSTGNQRLACALALGTLAALGCETVPVLATDADTGDEAAQDDGAHHPEAGREPFPHDAGMRRDAAPLTTDAAPALDADAGGPVDLTRACEVGPGAFGSCAFSGFPGRCHEAASDWGTHATIICIEDWGDRPSDGPCPSYGVVGRCYFPDDEYWAYHYSGSVEANRSACEAEAGVFCGHAPGVTDALAELCMAGCAEKKPSYSDAPECEQAAQECQPLCEQLVAYGSEACASCLLEQTFWEPGGCGEWECYCPGPTFPATDTPACASACSL